MDTQEPEKLGTPQKALLINLNAAVFGSFAEIGAGQEVARWFLRVGGASGTVAKTISAYDKEVSDDLYGSGTRYVSKPRLQAMMKNEWEQLLGQLAVTRGATTRFFSFVDTISARNFSGSNDCHGWMGLRFLQQAGGRPSDVILHVNLRDPSNVQQQEAVGILGVNLLYASQHDMKDPQSFLAGLLEDLSLERIELDCVELKGPAFEGWNCAELHARLVTEGHAEAVVFPVEGDPVPPNELLYKRAVVMAPGRFGGLEHLPAELLRITLEELPAEELKESKGALGLFCLSSAPPGEQGVESLPAAEIVRIVDDLRKAGYGVVLFRAPELYMMSALLTRYTKLRIHFAIGLSVLVRVMEDRYKNLPGSLLEGIARLFTQNVRLVVHPMKVEEVEEWVKQSGTTGWKWKGTNGMVYANDLHPAEPLDYLYRYLLSEFWILPSRKTVP
ncbi:MAG TPA: hypothetical protein VK703_07995 [Candidatus Acidoferrales bacterium]|jgi:hypothetical protein|nr:hypothetical protein [Candidatus Acidoferrales bacterium]